MELRIHPLRFSSIFLGLVFFLAFFSFRLVFLQVFRADYLARLADKQHNAFIELEPVRGTIFDRNMRPLAMNITAYSLFANPRDMSAHDKAQAFKKLPGLLNISTENLQNQLSKRKYFVWLKRKLTSDEADRIKALKIHGLGFIDESKRFYPNGSLAAHIIGFAGMDNKGLEGLELMYDHYLKGESGWSQVLKDARQRELMLEKGSIPPKDGFNVILTIDETIQYIAERALDKMYQKSRSEGAMIVVMDIKTGEILALANRPTYNLEQANLSPPENRTNRALHYVYEPGSIFKIVTTAAALEEKAFTETDKIFCENGEYRVANHILHDHHPHGTLTFQQVIEESSNIGVTKIAQKLGPQKIYDYAKKFRFGMKTGINLSGEVTGVLKPPSQWSKTSIGAIPIGHEVTVTPFQLVAAIGSIANDGVYVRPYIIKSVVDSNNQVIKSFDTIEVDRVITPETAKRVKAILKGVVENGTAKLAKIQGIDVAGKTGTAQKVVNGNYSHDSFYASFIGFAPVDEPRLAAVVMFDDPRGTHFGGTVAAPVFKEVIESSLRYLDASLAKN